MTNETFEVWYYANGDYDGCCGHQHDTREDAKPCLLLDDGRQARITDVSPFEDSALAARGSVQEDAR